MIAETNRTNAELGLPAYEMKTVPQGAATSVWAVIIADPDEVGGKYCEDCHVAPIDGSDARDEGVQP